MTKEYRAELRAINKKLKEHTRLARRMHANARKRHRDLDRDLRAFNKSVAKERGEIDRGKAIDLKAVAKDSAALTARKQILEGRLAS